MGLKLNCKCIDFLTRNGIDVKLEDENYKDLYEAIRYEDLSDRIWLPLVDFNTDKVVTDYRYFSCTVERTGYLFIQDNIRNFLDTGIKPSTSTRMSDIITSVNNFYYDFLFLREYLVKTNRGCKPKYEGYPILSGKLNDESFGIKVDRSKQMFIEVESGIGFNIPYDILCGDEIKLQEFCENLWRGYCRIRRKNTLRNAKDSLLFGEFKSDIQYLD